MSGYHEKRELSCAQHANQEYGTKKKNSKISWENCSSGKQSKYFKEALVEKKPCYHSSMRGLEECGILKSIYCESWEKCINGKLSEEHKQAEKDRHKQAVEIREEVEIFYKSILSSLCISTLDSREKAQLTEIIKAKL